MGFGGGSGCGLTTDPDDLNYQVCLKKSAYTLKIIIIITQKVKQSLFY